MCLADIRLITPVTVGRRDINGIFFSVPYLIFRLYLDGINPRTIFIFFNKVYSSVALISALHAEEVSVLGQAVISRITKTSIVHSSYYTTRTSPLLYSSMY